MLPGGSGRGGEPSALVPSPRPAVGHEAFTDGRPHGGSDGEARFSGGLRDVVSPGLPLLRHRKSTFIRGIEDAREVVGHLAANP